MAYQHSVSPAQDTGWGLIWRLNDLLKEIEVLAPKGDYDNWNYKLDRIWANLCYREKLEVKRDEAGFIIEICLCKSDYEEKEFLDLQINKYKKLMKDNKKEDKITKEYKSAKNKLYKSLLLKDIWIRKQMNTNQLYIKELKSDPSGAMWGK